MSFYKKFKGMRMDANLVSMLSYFLSALFTKAVSFLTIPIFTNLLDTADYGYVNTYTSVVAIGSFVLGLSLQNAINGIQKEKIFDEKEYQSAVMTMALGFLIVMTIFAYLVKQLLFPHFSTVVFFAAIFQAFATFVISFVSIEWRLYNRYIRYAVINVLPSFLSIVVSIFVITQLNSSKYLGRILPTMMIHCLVGAALMLMVLFRGKRFIALDMWKHALQYCLPLVMHTVSLLILEQSDRIMVASLSGMSEAGIYGFTHSFALAVQIVFVALENVWVSWFVKSMKEETSIEVINRRAKAFTEIYALFVVGFIFVSQEIVKIMAQESYWDGIHYIPLFVLASFLNLLYIFPVNNEYFERATANMATVSLAAALLNIVLNFVVIPYAGGMGAAFTTFVTYIFLLVVHWRNSRKLNNSLFPWKVFIRPTIFVIVGTAAYYMLYSLWIVRWIGIALFAIFYLTWLYREYGKELLNYT